MKVAEEILEFWFGALDDNGFAEPGKAKLWFGGKTVDALIAERFGEWVEQALASKLDAWADNPQGLMALVTLLDQFPRNIYRGSQQAYSGDARAREWVNLAIANGSDRTMPAAWRLMLYLPLEHTENLSEQNLSVAMYELLLASTPELCREQVTDSLRWARRHRDIVARFGRFPHRNAVMQRPSTGQERDWLAQGGERFGQ
jgi:uncharacterized protein (DUF924 family)